ncbi:hypothetical protein Ciccas_005094 [Cichlidogyrus casuarinus]|uniref:Dihydrolipoamide acetyltransferase component of pyruvate dehydrogenase complex n=1 Tax=Cichlidogyrus casuarinus TaxID=1844966 RepID=A0ABD2Q9N6_9PLAT
MTDGTIIAWHKKPGEKVNSGDMLCEIQTDKAVVAMDADEDGTMAKIFLEAGSQNIPIGTVIGVIASEDENWEEVASNAKQPKVESASPAPVESVKEEIKPTAPSHSSNDLMGPAARLLIEKHKLNATEIVSSGPHNIILKSDVLSFLDKQPTTQATAVSGADLSESIIIPLTSMRSTIAKRLTESKKTIPHLYTRATFSIKQLDKLRKLVKSGGIKVSLNDLVVKACALSLLAVPEMNAITKVGPGDQYVLQMQPNVDICVAVATPSGLITPIVKNADQLPVSGINQKVKELSDKAKANALKPEEFMGGSFTISNLGMFGIREFTAIINLPQVAILAVGGSCNVLDAEHWKADKQMTITLSTDARVIDEVTASNFLRHVAFFLMHNPRALVSDDADAQALVPLDFAHHAGSSSVDQFQSEQLHGLL